MSISPAITWFGSNCSSLIRLVGSKTALSVVVLERKARVLLSGLATIPEASILESIPTSSI